MRTYRHLLLFALSLTMLAGCAKDDFTASATGAGGEITFHIGFAGDARNAQTRVATDALFNSAWEDGDAIGIFAVTHGAALAATDNYIHNVRLTYSGGSWSFDSGVELYWPTGGAHLDFYAYYPYSAAADPTAIPSTVQLDQNGETDGKSNFNAGERLSAKSDNGGTGYGAATASVPLTFAHALAMVQLTLEASVMPTDPAEPPVVKLTGIIPAATLDLSAGTATVAGASPSADITMHRMAAGNPDEYIFRALVPVQTLAAGTQMFRITSVGTIFRSAPLSGDIALTPGTVETFTIAPAIDDYAVLIPDPVFRAYCLAQFDASGDGNNDGRLSHDEVMAATRIDLWSAGITTVASLEGIRYFKNLEYLNCSGNQLTELNVSDLPALTRLYCYNNQLTELNVSGLPALTGLDCSDNQLTELNVSDLPALTGLYCNSNQLTELNVSDLPALTGLYCNSNQLTELDVSGNGALIYLQCGNGPPLTVFVDARRTLLGDLEVRVDGGIGYQIRVNAKDTPTNGVTVKDKQ